MAIGQARAPGGAGLGVRLGARILRRDPRTPVERFGFHVHEAGSRERVQGIIAAFFTGYNAALASDDPVAIRAACAALPEVLQPFAFEGSGMGYGARGLLDRRARPERFTAHVEGVHPGWQFMHVIGLGIWTSRLGTWQTARVARRLTLPRLTGLLYDGYGFACGFFNRVRDPQAHRRLEALPATMRSHADRGFGRSLWFVFRDDRAGLVAAVEALPAAARAATVTGVGLAIVFTAVDDLVAAAACFEQLPPAWRRDLERGARLALFVRHAGQPEILTRWITSAGGDPWRAHLEQARRAHAASCDHASFLTDFTEAC